MPVRGNQGGQDLKEQVYHVKPKTDANAKPTTESGAARAVASGKATVEKKQHIALNAHTAGPGANAKRIDDDSETVKVKTVDHSVSVEIQKARQAKSWSQKDLAGAINEKQSIVTDYEAGKAVPNEQVMVRMEKALGVYLRGSKAGQPMEVKKFKKELKEEAAKKAEEDKKKKDAEKHEHHQAEADLAKLV